MAKKNISSLVSGLMGDTQPATPQDQTQESDIPAPKKIGRPKMDSNDIKATIVISPDLMRKVKYVALMEDAMIKTIVDSALSRYIEEWEEENGKIRFPKKG